MQFLFHPQHHESFAVNNTRLKKAIREYYFYQFCFKWVTPQILIKFPLFLLIYYCYKILET